MIDKHELEKAIGVYELLYDLIKDDFYVTISRHNQAIQCAEYVISIEKQIKEDEFIEDELKSYSFYGAVLQAWQRYIDESN